VPTEFKLKGGKRLQMALDPSRFKATSRKWLRLAAARNGKLGEQRMRATIKEGGFEKNADLTTAIKGSAKPLVDKSSSLFQAITSKVVGDTTTFVGIPSKDSFYRVAVAIHDGVTIPVTDKMRGLFYMLWRASVGDPVTLEGRAKDLFARYQGWLPLKASTKAIVLPKREFVKKTFQDSELHAMARKNWQDAINAALKEQARG